MSNYNKKSIKKNQYGDNISPSNTANLKQQEAIDWFDDWRNSPRGKEMLRKKNKNNELPIAQTGKLIDNFEEINNNTLVQAAKIFDPSGVTSYPDVYFAGRDLYNNPSWENAADFGINFVSALPLIGKAAIPLKLAKGTSKIISTGNKTAETLSKIESYPVDWVIRNFEGMGSVIPSTVRKGAIGLNDLKSYLGNATTEQLNKILNNTQRGFSNKKITKEEKINLIINGFNSINTSSDIYNAGQSVVNNMNNKTVPKAQWGDLLDSGPLSDLFKSGQDWSKAWRGDIFGQNSLINKTIYQNQKGLTPEKMYGDPASPFYDPNYKSKIETATTAATSDYDQQYELWQQAQRDPNYDPREWTHVMYGPEQYTNTVLEGDANIAQYKPKSDAQKLQQTAQGIFSGLQYQAGYQRPEPIKLQQGFQGTQWAQYGKSVAERYNNPMNVMYTKTTSSYGAQDSGQKQSDGNLNFARFNSPREGINAATQLLTKNYANSTVDETLKRYSNQGYDNKIIKSIPKNKKIKDLNSSELTAVLQAMGLNEMPKSYYNELSSKDMFNPNYELNESIRKNIKPINNSVPRESTAMAININNLQKYQYGGSVLRAQYGSEVKTTVKDPMNALAALRKYNYFQDISNEQFMALPVEQQDQMITAAMMDFNKNNPRSSANTTTQGEVVEEIRTPLSASTMEVVPGQQTPPELTEEQKFLIWYREQPEGTVQEYNGRKIKIDRGGEADRISIPSRSQTQGSSTPDKVVIKSGLAKDIYNKRYGGNIHHYQNGGTMNYTGYTPGTPTAMNRINIIPGDTVTSMPTNGVPLSNPILTIANLGKKKDSTGTNHGLINVLKPGETKQVVGANKIVELPMETTESGTARYGSSIHKKKEYGGNIIEDDLLYNSEVPKRQVGGSTDFLLSAANAINESNEAKDYLADLSKNAGVSSMYSTPEFNQRMLTTVPPSANVTNTSTATVGPGARAAYESMMNNPDDTVGDISQFIPKKVSAQNVKETYNLKGDKTYEYAKDENGNWITRRKGSNSDWNIISTSLDSEDRVNTAIDNLNKNAVKVNSGKSSANTSKSSNKNTSNNTNTNTIPDLTSNTFNYQDPYSYPGGGVKNSSTQVVTSNKNKSTTKPKSVRIVYESNPRYQTYKGDPNTESRLGGLFTMTPEEAKVWDSYVSGLSPIALSPTSSPKRYQYGGEINSDHTFPIHPITEEFTEIQTEKGETVFLPDGTIVDVKATQLHKNMDKDKVTDILPEGSYIFSNDKDMRFKLNDKIGGIKLEDMKVGKTAFEYKENEITAGPQDIYFKEVFGGKDNLTPADITRNIKKKFEVRDMKNDFFVSRANDENKSQRIEYLNILKTFSEFKKPKSKREIPKAQFGMNTSGLSPMYNQISNNAIDGVMGYTNKVMDPMYRMDNNVKSQFNISSVKSPKLFEDGGSVPHAALGDLIKLNPSFWVGDYIVKKRAEKKADELRRERQSIWNKKEEDTKKAGAMNMLTQAGTYAAGLNVPDTKYSDYGTEYATTQDAYNRASAINKANTYAMSQGLGSAASLARYAGGMNPQMGSYLAQSDAANRAMIQQAAGQEANLELQKAQALNQYTTLGESAADQAANQRAQQLYNVNVAGLGNLGRSGTDYLSSMGDLRFDRGMDKMTYDQYLEQRVKQARENYENQVKGVYTGALDAASMVMGVPGVMGGSGVKPSSSADGMYNVYGMDSALNFTNPANMSPISGQFASNNMPQLNNPSVSNTSIFNMNTAVPGATVNRFGTLFNPFNPR